MKIGDKLKTLAQYFEMTRQAGHTSLMMRGVLSEVKCFILSLNHSCGKDMKKQWGLANGAHVITPNSLNGLCGGNIPLAIDNGVLWQLFSEGAQEIQDLENENRILKQKIENIKNILK